MTRWSRFRLISAFALALFASTLVATAAALTPAQTDTEAVAAAETAFLFEWHDSPAGDGKFKRLFGIAVDGAGNVYVADSGNNMVQKFSDRGEFLTKWGTPGGADGQFVRPVCLRLDLRY